MQHSSNKAYVSLKFWQMADVSSLDLLNNPFTHAKRLYRLSPLAGKNRIHRLKQRPSPVISSPSVSVFADDRRRPRSSGERW